MGTSSALSILDPITLEHSPLHPTTKKINNGTIKINDEAYDNYEEKVRRKALTLVKKKIDQRFKDVEIDILNMLYFLSKQMV